MAEVKSSGTTHNMILENRSKLSVSSVSDVDNFDEKQITAFTEMGFLTIKGSNLHIKNFNTETGELNVWGKIDELTYSNNQKRTSTNLVSKLFK